MPDAIVTREDDPAQYDPFLVCGKCRAHICTIEEGDSLDVLKRTADDHVCDSNPEGRNG